MKINNLKITNCLGIKKLDLNVAENEKIIGVICERKGVFEKSDFTYIMEQVFGDYFKLRGGKIECLCQKNGKCFYLNLTAEKKEENKLVFGKELSGKTIERKETCLCEDLVDGKIKWVCGLDYRQWLYPSPFADYGFFHGKTMLDELICGIEYDDLFETTHVNDKQELLNSLNKHLIEFPVFYLSNKSIGIDSDGRLGVINDGFFNSEIDKILTEKELLVASFIGWTCALNILSELCHDTGRNLDFPVFIDGFFSKLEKENFDLIFNSLRKTKRQVFVIVDESNEKIFSYCDKVVKADMIEK